SWARMLATATSMCRSSLRTGTTYVTPCMLFTSTDAILFSLLSTVFIEKVSGGSMRTAKIVVCSFYTDDDYYLACATKLRTNLTELGVAHQLEAIDKAPGEDWADICCKKVGFLARVCEQHPDAKVF